MDPLIIFLLAVIILAGGFIGMVADHLGRKIGKKKLSFRTMRPKHVARLGTFIAGVLISAFTILLVFFTSSDIRKWIERGRQLIKDEQALSDKNQKLEAAIKAETEKISRLDGEATAAKRTLQLAQSNLAGVQQQLVTANLSLVDARRRVEEGKLALTKNQALLRKSQQLLASKQSKLASVSTKLSAAQANYAALQKSYKTVDSERVQANEEVTKLREKRDSLTAEVAQLRTETQQLTKDEETAKEELANARADLHQGVLELDNVRTALEDARASLQIAQTESKNALNVAATSRSQPLMFPINQEVQRLELPPHLSERQAQQAWNRLMQLTSQAASARGAEPLKGSTSCVFLLPWRPSGPNGPIASPEQQQQAILEKITGQEQDIVLIAQASINTFRGEPVPLNIVGLPNPVVYHKGELLAELHVGRHWPKAQAFAQLRDFMNQKVHDKLMAKMIPVVGQEASLGDVPPDKTFELVDEMTGAPRDAILQVSCHAETRAGDSLQLDFRFK